MTENRDIRNKDGSFMSEAQIVDDLVKQIKSDTNSFRDWQIASKDEALRLHHSLGMQIRNLYGLWYPENPINGLETGEGAVLIHMDPNSPKHPDNISNRILGKVWDKLHDIGQPIKA